MSHWTPAIDDFLEQLIHARYSARTAAIEINRKFGHDVSRNAIIGRAARKGWGFNSEGARNSAKKRVRMTVRKATLVQTKIKRVTYQAMTMPEPRAFNAPVEPQARGPKNDFPAGNLCRWIHGDPSQPGWHCCAARQLDGSSYCAHHYERSCNHLTEKQKQIAEPGAKLPNWAA